MIKGKLNTFIQLLQKVQREPSKVFDLGLIVGEPQNRLDIDEVFKEIKKILPIERITYEKDISDEKVIGRIIKAFEQQKWIFLEIKKDVGSLLLNQLKHLANYNSFQILNYKDKDVFEMKMPKKSRVIVYVERDLIDKKITYPNFYQLFGPILNLD